MSGVPLSTFHHFPCVYVYTPCVYEYGLTSWQVSPVILKLSRKTTRNDHIGRKEQEATCWKCASCCSREPMHWILQTSGFWMELVVPGVLRDCQVPRKTTRAPRTQPRTSIPTAIPATAPPSSLSESESESDEFPAACPSPGVPNGHEGNTTSGAWHAQLPPPSLWPCPPGWRGTS